MAWWRRRPLRTQLLAIVIVLGALALFAAGAVASAALRTYLQGQIDQQLVQVTRSDRPLGGGDRLPQPGGPGRFMPHDDDDDRSPPGEFYSAVVGSDGMAQVISRPFGDGAPDLGAAAAVTPGAPATVSGDGGSWRVVTQPYNQGTLVVAKPLSEIDAIVARLMALELAIGALVLGLLALAAFFAIRASLRPLADVEHTATAIAAGDLSRRVPDHEPTTEVGQLSAAFNTMLDEINDTIDERDVALQDSRASEARMRQFVADASHELRTPLTTIRGYSELYRQGGIPDPNVPETFGRVEGEALRMGALVDDLLLLARLDQQRPLEQGRVDLLEVATDVVHAAGARHPQRSVRLKSYGTEVPVVTGDEATLRQVLTNLVGNALKYSDGDVRIVVDTRSTGWVRMSVEDHGAGIPDAEKARVFERFYRGDPSRTRAAGGSGLGLSIVSAIVTAHHGQAQVRDNEGSGTIVDIWLPAT